MENTIFAALVPLAAAVLSGLIVLVLLTRSSIPDVGRKHGSDEPCPGLDRERPARRPSLRIRERESRPDKRSARR